VQDDKKVAAYDPSIHHRRSLRLRGYDYRQAGAYFVTICTQGRASMLGTIVDASVRLSDVGQVVAESWALIPAWYPHIDPDEWIVMPNHIHGILVFTDEARADDGRSAHAPVSLAPSKPLGRVIGAFKTHSTKRANDLRNTPGDVFWQRNYFEHIIRDENSLNRIRQYIASNPERWGEDPDNPAYKSNRVP
jgi:REP element-mobilizing transposase RayT